MKRRNLLRYLGVSALTAASTGLAIQSKGFAQTPNAVSVRWLGHTCFLITGNGRRILINPFRTLGCTAKYRVPKVESDLVMISSQLLDEGAVEVVSGNPRLLYEPGDYQVLDLRVRGIPIDHDRIGGKRFGTNIAWQWSQSNINFMHLGGAAAPLSIEQRILAGRPDVLFVPVGGGPKAYTAEEAKQAVTTLNPRMVIPTHYRTEAADPNACDITPLEPFLELMQGTSVRRANSDTISLRSSDLPKEGMVIQVMSYKF